MANGPIENKFGWLFGGGVIAAFAASLCCVGPVVLTFLGVSGAVVLPQVEFLRLPIIIVLIALFGLTGCYLYRKKKQCEPNSICADPVKYKRLFIFYWTGLVMSVLLVTSPYWLMWF